MNSNDLFWSKKALWCRPWSILLTGIIFISASFFILRNVIITFLISFLVIIWWFIFLYLAPNYYVEHHE